MAEDNDAFRQDVYTLPKGLSGPDTHTYAYLPLRVYDALRGTVTDTCHTYV